MPREVGLFVNVSNQFYTTHNIFRGGKIDYQKYLNRAVGDNEQLYRAFAYGVQMDREASGFIACLQQFGYETNYKQARVIDGKPSIRHTDRNMDMAMDVMRCLEKLDTVVIGSNDPNLIPLVKFIRDRGKKVIILSCCIGRELREAANQCIEIKDDLLEDKKTDEPDLPENEES